jgi:hypothetical protein
MANPAAAIIVVVASAVPAIVIAAIAVAVVAIVVVAPVVRRGFDGRFTRGRLGS